MAYVIKTKHCTLFTAAKPAQRVFRIKMLFPSDVLCNEAGQGVLRQRVKNAVNSLNRDWNFCSYSTEGSRLVFIFVAVAYDEQ